MFSVLDLYRSERRGELFIYIYIYIYIHPIPAAPPRPLVPNTVINSMWFLWTGEPVWSGGKALGW